MKNPRNPMKSEDCLGSTGEIPIPAPLSPFVLRRYYTDDGRLVIRRERVIGREYFLADRSNGRLALSLVPVSDHDSDDNIDNVDNDDIGEVSCDYTEKLGTNLGAESRIKRRKTVLGAELRIKRRKMVGNGDSNNIDIDDEEDTGEVSCDNTEKETNLGAEPRIKRRKTVGNGGGGHSLQYCSVSRSPRLLDGGGTPAAAAVKSVHV